MITRAPQCVLLVVCILKLVTWAQEAVPKEPQPLRVLDTIVIESQLAGITQDPLKCDKDGNLFVHPYESGRVAFPVRKFDPKGKTLATYSFSSALDLQFVGAGYFNIAPNGDFYQIAWTDDATYVVRFAKDGALKSSTRLDLPFYASKVAVFESGRMLLAGRREFKDSQGNQSPFTAIVDSSGKMVKEVSLADDQKIREAAERGDADYVNPLFPAATNQAIDLGQAVSGPDGNVYVMRRMVPVPISVISDAGEVLRTLHVEAPDLLMKPESIQVVESRVAILFRNEQSKDQIIRVVDSQTGEDQALYDAKDLGPAFLCYTGPDEFTFLSAKGGKMAFLRVGP